MLAWDIKDVFFVNDKFIKTVFILRRKFGDHTDFKSACFCGCGRINDRSAYFDYLIVKIINVVIERYMSYLQRVVMSFHTVPLT